jgi:prevent-host-death family protein
MRWQSEEAGQRLDEILRAAESEPQIITGHGEEVAVDISIAEYRTLRGDARGVPPVHPANRSAIGSLAGQIDLSGGWDAPGRDDVP